MNSPQFVQAHAAPFNLGFSVSGAFCEPTGPTCIEYDGTKFLLDPPAQFAGFAIEADGDSIIYSTASPGASMETYDFANGNRKMVIFEGKNDTGIHFRRTYFWITGNGWQPEPQPGIIQITTEITNHSGSALQGLELVEVLDPVIGGQDSTYNEVLSGGTAVTASGAENGYTLLLGSPDPRASVAVDTIAVLDPDLVLNSTYLPDSLVAEDKNLGLAFDLGMLENGARATANYFIIVAPQKAKVVQSYTNSEMDRRLGSPDDFYQLSLSDGQRLIATTTTPYQANLNYRNEFNPYLVLYNQIGEVVASDDNSAGDNRNAQLVYDVPPGSGGDYRLVISASTELVANRLPHGSEYVLSIELPNPPVLEAIPSPVGVRQMTTWYISPTATDPDLPDDLLVFSLVNPPAGMTISPSDGFTSWTPGKEVSPQTYTFIMRVTDSTGLSDEQALGINVLPLLQTFLPAVVVGH
jgi:hypothetical protein